jgi:ABC-type uncharacterized transport system involved in gliding motility auxiliary subunit
MKINRNELGTLATLLGGALLLSGLVRYSVQNVWGWSLWFVLAGAILLVVGLAIHFRAILGFFQGRSGKLGTNTLVLVVAVLAILGIINFLGYRHHKRIDLTAEQLYSLSDQTRKVVAGLQKDVKIVKFGKREDQAFRDRIAEYKGAGRRISYEFVDPFAKPEVAKQYKITREDETIVAAGDRMERPSETDEQSLTNAILKVTRDSLKMICFTEGHGERPLSGADAEGFANAEKKVKNENYETKAVSLATGQGSVPAECAVLVVAGPKQPLLAPEVGMIGKYLDGGGKVMFLFDPDTDPQVNDVLKNWNIELGANTVIDVSAAGQMFGGGPLAPLVMNYGSHPITDSFGRTMTIFPNARQVKVGSGSGSGANATTILSTTEASWGEAAIKPGVAPKYDEGQDVKGPVTLGAVASKNMGENKEARLVVIGDSDFASNRAFGFQRNGDLFLNSINWLAQDEDLIAIRPKSATNRSVTMDESVRRMFSWLIMALLPLMVMGTGIYVWWTRR